MSCSHTLTAFHLCYFCKGEQQTEVKLADGCTVSSCEACFQRTIADRKTAQERGFYDPSKLSVSQQTYHKYGEIGNGENKMAQIQKVKENTGTGLPWLAKKTYQENGIRHVKIATEAQMVDTEYQGKPTGQKPECTVETNSTDAPKCIWTMNKKTQNYMVEKFGSDSANWVGKEFDIKLARAGNANPSIYPSDLSLEEIIE